MPFLRAVQVFQGWLICISCWQSAIIASQTQSFSYENNAQSCLLHRVLERYPASAKLARAYGRFCEDVRHAAGAANRCYAQADKLGANEATLPGAGSTGTFLLRIVRFAAFTSS